MSFSRRVTLKYLGSRNYLQGTTLFSALWDLVPARGAGFSFKIPSFIRSDVIEIISYGADERAPPKWDAILKWRAQGTGGVFVATASTPSPEPVREPYDEAAIVREGRFSELGVLYDGRSEFDFVQTIVALNKEFLLRFVSADSSRQWIFTRLDMQTLPRDVGNLQLAPKAFGPGKRSCCSTVTWNDGEVGNLYFAQVDRTR